MNLKITGVVKYNGKWKRPGDELLSITEDVGNDLLAKGLAVPLPKSQAEINAEEQAAKDAEAAAIAAEEAKTAEVEKKEAEKQLKALRKKATDLGIEGAVDKDAETLTAEIEAVEKK